MKNIDIVKVNKKNKADESSRHIYHVPRRTVPTGRKNLFNKKIGLGLAFSVRHSILSVFSSDIFLFSFIRNIFSLRTVLFAIFPFVYFSTRYLLVLKPDQLLASVKNIISPANTFQFVGIGLAVLVIFILSWIADTILVSAMYRFEYQRIDSRPVKLPSSIRETVKNIGPIVASKLMRLIIFGLILVLMFALLYGFYVVGYGSLSLQIGLFVFIAAIFLVIYLIYIKFRYYIQAISAIGLNSQQNKFIISLKQSFGRPLRAISQGGVWAFLLIIFVFISAFLVYLEITLLNGGGSVIFNILMLAILSTLIYLTWTTWTALQVGYWSSLANYERSISKLHFQPDEDGGYLGLWVLIILVLITVALYFALAIVFSAQVSDFLVGIWTKLPDSIKINLPKPN